MIQFACDSCGQKIEEKLSEIFPLTTSAFRVHVPKDDRVFQYVFCANCTKTITLEHLICIVEQERSRSI